MHTQKEDTRNAGHEIINLSTAAERAYWTQRLRITERELAYAVRLVGAHAGPVRTYLQRRGIGIKVV